jgi:hypothetical protein
MPPGGGIAMLDAVHQNEIISGAVILGKVEHVLAVLSRSQFHDVTYKEENAGNQLFQLF